MVQQDFCYKELWYRTLRVKTPLSMGTGKSFLVKDDDWFVIVQVFFPLGEGHIWAKLKKKLKLTSPHVREPDYCQHQVRLPTTRSTRYTRSLFFHSALFWNTLPNSIQSHSSTSSFQHAFEEHWHAYKYLTDTDIPLPPVQLEWHQPSPMVLPSPHSA